MTQEVILSPEDVADIVAILDGTSYDRIDVATARFKLRVARSGDGWTQDWTWESDDRPVAVSAAADEKAAQDEAPGDESIVVNPPLPGIFYRSPQPGAPPFIEVGDAVLPDTVIGIIETMKLMNPVPAGVSGTVTAIVAKDGLQVDVDSVLIRVAAGTA